MNNDEVRAARAYLTYVFLGATPAVSTFVRREGVIAAAAAIRAGTAPREVLDRAADRDATDEEVLTAPDGARFIIPGDREWPTDAFTELRAQGTEPFGLWLLGSGSLAALTERAVAIVGSLEYTAYGWDAAMDLATAAAASAITVVARERTGIDHHVLRHALSEEGGAAIAVLAGGVGEPIGPAIQRHRAWLIKEGGLLVSEYSPSRIDTTAGASQSYRLIAALTRATVIAEISKEDKRTPDVARAASVVGRPVYVAYPPLTANAPSGVHGLVTQGLAMPLGAISDVRAIGSLPRPRDARQNVVEAVRWGWRASGDFLVDVIDRPTFEAALDAIGEWNAFDPRKVKETISDLFDGAMAVRFGNNTAGPVLEVDFPSFEFNAMAHRGRMNGLSAQVTPEDHRTMAARWIVWAREVRADSIAVYQRSGDVVQRRVGEDPIGIRLWWD